MKLFGRTFTNKIVNFKGSTDLIGQIIDVKIKNLTEFIRWSFIGYKIDTKKYDQHIKLEPIDNDRLIRLCGLLDKNIRQIENFLKLKYLIEVMLSKFQVEILT